MFYTLVIHHDLFLNYFLNNLKVVFTLDKIKYSLILPKKKQVVPLRLEKINLILHLNNVSTDSSVLLACSF